MILHVMPTYQCNLICPYCYLGTKRSNNKIMPIESLKEKLNELKASLYIVDAVNIYGGEITLLSREYLHDLIDVLQNVTENISVTSNLFNSKAWKTIEWIRKDYPKIHIATSINDERPHNNELIQKLLMQEKHDISLTYVVTPSLLKKPIQEIFHEIEMISSSVEFLRYSPSHLNPYWKESNKAYEDFLIRIINEYQKGIYNFYLHNIDDIRNCIDKTYNPYLDSNVFLNPDGKFCIVDYIDGKESFLAVSLTRLIKEAQEEKAFWQDRCYGCKYIDHCYAEHMKINAKGDSCCGCKKLLRFYEKNLY